MAIALKIEVLMRWADDWYRQENNTKSFLVHCKDHLVDQVWNDEHGGRPHKFLQV